MVGTRLSLCVQTRTWVKSATTNAMAAMQMDKRLPTRLAWRAGAGTGGTERTADTGVGSVREREWGLVLARYVLSLAMLSMAISSTASGPRNTLRPSPASLGLSTTPTLLACVQVRWFRRSSML